MREKKSLSDKRFCVYVLKDAEGVVRYVGSGNKNRPFVKSGRSSEYLKVALNGHIEVLHDDVSRVEAFDLENDYLSRYLAGELPGWLLLNKLKTAKRTEYRYEYFSKFLEYDETSPTMLRWLVEVHGGGVKNRCLLRKIGDSAGSIRKYGYSSVTIASSKYATHKIVYSLYHKTDIPQDMVVDHIDSNKSNNRISNLQLLSPQGNCLKSLRKILRSSNKSGYSGISQDDGYWDMTITCAYTGKVLKRRYNTRVLGDLGAFNKAVEMRKSLELKNNGKEPLCFDDEILQVNNKSGSTGVYLHTGRSYLSWVGSVRCLRANKNITKSFSILKYGHDEAFRLACEFRAKILDQNKQLEKGEGYASEFNPASQVDHPG